MRFHHLTISTDLPSFCRKCTFKWTLWIHAIHISSFRFLSENCLSFGRKQVYRLWINNSFSSVVVWYINGIFFLLYSLGFPHIHPWPAFFMMSKCYFLPIPFHCLPYLHYCCSYLYESYLFSLFLFAAAAAVACKKATFIYDKACEQNSTWKKICKGVRGIYRFQNMKNPTKLHLSHFTFNIQINYPTSTQSTAEIFELDPLVTSLLTDIIL